MVIFKYVVCNRYFVVCTKKFGRVLCKETASHGSVMHETRILVLESYENTNRRREVHFWTDLRLKHMRTLGRHDMQT